MQTTPHLPPGPSNRYLSTWRFMKDPGGTIRECRRRYGDTFTYPILHRTVVMTVEPELVRAFFQAGHGPFSKKGSIALGLALGHGSMFHLGGEAHLRHRRLLAPPFHARSVHRYLEMMTQVVEAHLDRWCEEGSVVLLDAINEISLEIILRTVFGLRSDDNLRSGGRVVDAFVRAFRPSFLALGFLRHRVYRPWSDFLDVRVQLRDLLAGEIEERRASGERGDDILSFMLDARYEDGSPMDQEEMIDELVTLLVAGHETTTIAMTWAAYFLERQPETLGRLLEELAGASSLAEAPWLDAVCNEALRLYPVVPSVSRPVAETFELGEWVIPPGHAVGVGIVGLHQREDLYPEPLSFRPERFLERKYGPDEFLPFGGGVRKCLGMAFAVLEMKVVVAALASRVELERLSDEPAVPVRRNVTLAPKGGVPMRVRRRSQPLPTPLDAGACPHEAVPRG